LVTNSILVTAKSLLKLVWKTFWTEITPLTPIGTEFRDRDEISL